MARHGTGGRWRLQAALTASVGLLASTARADEARATCAATLTGRRVVVRSEARAFVSPELDRLVRLGMAGKLEVQLTLMRRRSLWFDARMDSTQVTQVLAFTRTGYLLDGRPLAEGVATLELERVAWMLDAPPEPGERFIVQVEVRLHVVTAASLGRVATWLTQGASAGTEPDDRSALTATLLRSVAEDLARGASGRCDVLRSP
ncbi:hypothetical protein D7Y13_05960 [Corallococcus praedator]|uniref:DUF4390 domain-containing protein n=1 Tax=Corallococcus praedator TaxID=2316724 RepID=A0ABX9QNP5_9BACT|nr:MULTISPECIES: hypothetical protein [Corallococcus]RKH14984.1 hypothetical protein D7X74_19185 [Corallococcus sp. CA047B]RKH33403.1 hypothetical protein D7X75_12260 [Corallococcus sp. CA031C]RKI14527.1 hypothetical protein D7Y13_05960 [Corallococcus praedator]